MVKAGILAAAAVVLVTSLGPAPAATATTAAAPHRGPATGVPWLAGNLLHTGAGRTVEVPWTARQARQQSLRLLGRAEGGWLLKSFTHGYRWTTWLVAHGRRTELSSSSVTEGDVVLERIADDGRHYATETYNDANPDNSVAVRGLDGQPTAVRTFEGDAFVLDLSGTQAVVGTDHARLWSFGTDTVDDLGVPAVGADLEHDLLLVDAGAGQVGPTSISAPGEPAWTAPLEQAVVSPAGGRLVARDPARPRVLVVRNVTTGEVVATLGIGRFLQSDAPVWASNRAVLFVAATSSLGDREVLVRCRLTGACTRLTEPRPRDTISIGLPTTAP